jgi:hypothetical protein
MVMRWVVAGLWLVMVLLAPPAPLAAAEPVGRVARQVGAVVVLRQLRPQPLIIGSEVFADDTIRTGPSAKARIDCRNGLTIVIGPDTELRLASYLADPAGGLDVFLGLLSGIVRLIGAAQPGERRIEVETRNAVASVRSTDWLVDLKPDSTGVFVAEGGVEVRSRSGGSVVLAPTEGTDVRDGAAPTPARRWGAARRDAALARTTL